MRIMRFREGSDVFEVIWLYVRFGLLNVSEGKNVFFIVLSFFGDLVGYLGM